MNEWEQQDPLGGRQPKPGFPHQQPPTPGQPPHNPAPPQQSGFPHQQPLTPGQPPGHVPPAAQPQPAAARPYPQNPDSPFPLPASSTPATPKPQSQHWFRALLATTVGKVVVGLAVVGFVAGMAWVFLTTTQIENVEAGKCFASWDDFDGGSSGEYVPDSVDDAECSEPHAVQAFHVSETGDVFECENVYNNSVIAPPGVTLEWFAISITSGFGAEVDKVLCFVGHADRTTLITGSVLS